MNTLRERLCTHTSGIGLNIDAPFGGVKVERLECALTAQNFQLVNVLVATVVASIRKTFRVLVGQNGAIRLHRGLTRQILHEVVSLQ